jgi:hypothetical protein
VPHAPQNRTDCGYIAIHFGHCFVFSKSGRRYPLEENSFPLDTYRPLFAGLNRGRLRRAIRELTQNWSKSGVAARATPSMRALRSSLYLLIFQFVRSISF